MRKFIFLIPAVLLLFSCAGGAGGAGEIVDALTEDGDYYYNGNGNNGSGINVNIGGSGLGWVSNAGYGYSSGSGNVNVGGGGSSSSGSSGQYINSEMSTEEFIRLNDARSRIDEEQYSAAIDILKRLLDDYPDNADALELYQNLKRWMEIPSIISSKKAELEKLNSEIADLLVRIEKQKQIVEEARKVMEDDYNAYLDLNARLEEKNKDVSSAYTALQDLRKKYEAETDPARKAELKAQLDKAQSDYDALLAERDLLKGQVEAAYSKYLASKARYESELATLQQLIDEYNAKCKRRDELTLEIHDLENEYETLSLYLKKIKHVSSGLADYSYSMRWSVKDNTSVYSAYKDITRFIYTIDEYDDALYAIVGKFGEYEFDDANYGVLSLRYRKNPSNKPASTSSLYATFGGTSSTYWDNTNVPVPQAIVASGPTGGSVYNARYTTDMVEMVLYDSAGGILSTKQFPYKVYECYGGSGDAFNLFKSRIASYEEYYGAKFPVTNVTLFARANRVKSPK